MGARTRGRDEPARRESPRTRRTPPQAAVYDHLDRPENGEEAEMHLRQVVESLPAILWRAAAGASSHTFVSHEAEALLGYPVRRWLTEPGFWSNHLHPDDREWVDRRRGRAAREPDPLKLEYRMIAADGRVVWFRDVSQVVRNGSGRRELVGTMIDITESRAALEALRRARERASARLGWVREEERAAIAREVHDELGQALTALKMDIAWLRRRLDGAAVAPRAALVERIGRMSELADETIVRVRRLAREMRPGLLDQLGLPAAIEWQAREFESWAGVRCEVSCDAGEHPLERSTATAVFGILQEALTNVGRHAAASRVTVALVRHGGTLLLTVRDDGRGIPAQASSRADGSGLVGMTERARRLGGSLTVSARRGGTEVRVAVPLQTEQASP